MLDLLQEAVVPPGSASSPSISAADVGSMNVTLSQPLFEYLLSLQKSFEVALQKCLDAMKNEQEEREQVLKQFIQEELQLLNASLVHEVQTSSAVCLGSSMDIRKSMEERTEQILGKVSEASFWPDMTSVDVQLQAASEISGQDEVHRNNTVTPDVWRTFQEVQNEVDSRCIYNSVLERKIAKRSVWHHVLHSLGYAGLVRVQMPRNCLARLTEHPVFVTFQTLLILSNTGIIGYEADLSIKAALQEPKGEVPRWLNTCNSVFNVLFVGELLLRMIALGSWFWVAPNDWGWNVFDACLVISSVASDLLSGINLNFIRTFRVLRAVRVARLIRVLRFFRNLRKMLFAILACLSSLAWAFLFLAMVMFMFAILFVQGAVQVLENVAAAPADQIYARSKIELWFGSLSSAMLSLLAAVTGGADWLEIRKPLLHAGQLYAVAFVVYMLFVTVGVMNVLTGVFLTNADEFVDLSLIVQSEESRVDAFVEQLLELFHTLDVSHTGEVDWPTFNTVLRDDRVRAYFSSLQLEPTHVRLIFSLLDQKGKGKITIHDLVMGMVRLKGEAKAIDARIIQREIGMLPLFFKNFREYLVSKLLMPARQSSPSTSM